MADAWIEDVFESDDGDFSSWEMINASEDDDENEDYSYDEDEDLYVLESLSSDLSTQTSPPDLIDHTNDSDHDDHLRKDLLKQVSIDERDGYNDYDDEEEDEKEEDGYDDDGGECDLDDELVPKSVRDRFGRQRLRKLGKRAYPKMNKCKRLPYHYNRPGCVYGKHGLGLKHNIII